MLVESQLRKIKGRRNRCPPKPWNSRLKKSLAPPSRITPCLATKNSTRRFRPKLSTMLLVELPQTIRLIVQPREFCLSNNKWVMRKIWILENKCCRVHLWAHVIMHLSLVARKLEKRSYSCIAEEAQFKMVAKRFLRQLCMNSIWKMKMLF